MSTILRTRIVKIGNSQGIRIPKPLLEQAGLVGAIEVEVEGGQLVLRPVTEPTRQGWNEQFEAMASRGEDGLLDAELAGGSNWEATEWQW